jgi:hypothetical protein
MLSTISKLPSNPVTSWLRGAICRYDELISTTGATNGAGTANSSGAPEFILQMMTQWIKIKINNMATVEEFEDNKG